MVLLAPGHTYSVGVTVTVRRATVTRSSADTYAIGLPKLVGGGKGAGCHPGVPAKDSLERTISGQRGEAAGGLTCCARRPGPSGAG